MTAFVIGIKRALRRFFKIDQYEFINGSIICHHGWWRSEAIPVTEIESWVIFHEMIFDIICVHLKEQPEIQLTDSEGELSKILLRVVGAPHREQSL